MAAGAASLSAAPPRRATPGSRCAAPRSSPAAPQPRLAGPRCQTAAAAPHRPGGRRPLAARQARTPPAMLHPATSCKEVNHATPLSATTSPGNLPRLRLTKNSALKRHAFQIDTFGTEVTTRPIRCCRRPRCCSAAEAREQCARQRPGTSDRHTMRSHGSAEQRRPLPRAWPGQSGLSATQSPRSAACSRQQERCRASVLRCGWRGWPEAARRWLGGSSTSRPLDAFQVWLWSCPDWLCCVLGLNGPVCPS